MNRKLLKNISKNISSGLTPLRSNEKYWNSKDIPWINIKNNILSAAENIWGVRPDENDTTIQQVMAINDVAKREQMLRQEGLNRGYETVVNDLYGSMSQSFGTGIVKSLDYELNPGG